ncbi:hypothetical protein T265_06775 [Opisthorchis viverrini]|uniref:Mannose-P-dolichol utilization defect 1 protein homolog n=1 Tax=Opisthorchis viverrini TaxID=6198 RepID=A0A074ZFA0_OPIVI|nr:hypothetical protein T265_06775 [Opisthorchis viverrini]KER25863.1 hypothetical protein T265_06775 [Opisthorchis viverrini]
MHAMDAPGDSDSPKAGVHDNFCGWKTETKLMSQSPVSKVVHHQCLHMNQSNSYGEATFLALQTFIITWLAITWKSQPLGVAFSAVYVAGLAVTFSPVMPLSVLYTLQTLNVPIMLVSKILQIAANWRNGSTGQLSAITLCLFALGSTARIFTSLEETGDNLIILTYILSTLCNYILMGQVFYYWNSSAPSAKKTSKNSSASMRFGFEPTQSCSSTLHSSDVERMPNSKAELCRLFNIVCSTTLSDPRTAILSVYSISVSGRPGSTSTP